MDNDPEGKYTDALLTPAGEAQARALQPRTQPLSPQLLVVSPLRRATQTGLLAFEAHVQAGRLPVIAHEGCHERGGKHTCDRRLASPNPSPNPDPNPDPTPNPDPNPSPNTCDRRLARSVLASAYPSVSYAYP